jgi:hypothetical protein
MTPRTVPFAVAALAAAAILAGCAAQSPEDRVTALRAEYEASLNSFQVIERPVAPPPATAPVEEAAAGPPGAEPVAGEDEPTPPVGDAAPAGEEEAAPSEPAPAAQDVRQDVLLDIVIRNRSSDDRLPGLTLDVEQVDPQGEPKTSYRIWVDTSNIAPGAEGAVSHRLEDVGYVEGDGFNVEVRQAIPPEQRGEYRELSEAGEQP